MKRTSVEVRWERKGTANRLNDTWWHDGVINVRNTNFVLLPLLKFPHSLPLVASICVYFVLLIYKTAKRRKRNYTYNKNRYHQSVCVWQTMRLLNDETTNKSESNIESENPFFCLRLPIWSVDVCRTHEEKTNRILLSF